MVRSGVPEIGVTTVDSSAGRSTIVDHEEEEADAARIANEKIGAATGPRCSLLQVLWRRKEQSVASGGGAAGRGDLASSMVEGGEFLRGGLKRRRKSGRNRETSERDNHNLVKARHLVRPLF